MKWPWTGGPPEPSAREQIEESLRGMRLQLAQAYASFNAAADGELVESYIYEIQALQARYSYLLRQRKELDDSPVPARTSSALPVA